MEAPEQEMLVEVESDRNSGARARCVSETMCTVTGPAVIDIHDGVSFVQDRCVYELMTPTTSPNIKILAEFRERRRSDVSFLYRLIVQKDSNVIGVVDQYGKVWVDGTLVTLTSTPQLFNNMMLSQDQTGVTLQMSLSFNVTVFFHDNTAQIYIKGTDTEILEGQNKENVQLAAKYKLCVLLMFFESTENAGTVLTFCLSPPSCATQYNDTADPTINCTAMSQRCALLMGAPFTTCNINPQPYIQACSYTLCRYPAVDGLKCTFMEAYATDCGLRGNTTIDGWRSSVSCPGPQAFCQGKFCSAHEFCGEKTAGGDTQCFCRAIFASQYGSVFGRQTICKDNSASVSLATCLLEAAHIDYTILHLIDPNCRGHANNMTGMVTFSFDSTNTCGTVVTSNDTHISYMNTIMSHNISNEIVREEEVLIEFSCFYDQPHLKSTDIQIQDRCVLVQRPNDHQTVKQCVCVLFSSVIQHVRDGQWIYNLTMKAYLDSAYTQTLEGVASIQLNQKIWVELEADGLDSNIVALVIQSCWATHELLSNGSLRYDLIVNSCANPNDGTVMVERNGQGTNSSFSFNTFKFSGQTGDISLHCQVHLCSTINNNCVPVQLTDVDLTMIQPSAFLFTPSPLLLAVAL
ncbi:alpha-tectorin-like [Thalassophryne amazonica]|uniref:alpha-tectorin-like n=1 Tax=Thalassophryne amazonica TaxID=390379 RepID=UPI0014712F41|nr:alpha-tectorin-like [Thalassophryne amazonica]